MKQILTLTFLFFALCAPAKIVKKNVPSHKMNRSIPCVIVLPDSYDKKAAYPVIYLLHGYGGDQNSWITIKPVSYTHLCQYERTLYMESLWS